MKKVLLMSILALSSLSLLGVAARVNLVHAQSRVTLYVGAGQVYTTIQAALNAANSEDTIFVYNGTYYEHVNITKTVSLLGLDKETTIIDGESNGTVITLNANNASIRGFTIKNGVSAPGIALNNSNHNSIEDNIIANNYDAIRLENSSNNNIIRGNVIESNDFLGIKIVRSNNNIISANSLEFNRWYGIYITTSSGNVVYHNNFLGNEKQAFNTPDSVTVWDYGNEGNYWSDYQGLDSNKDGIGDTPYIIPSFSADSYPLMGKFSDFSVAFQEKNFEVSVISNSTVSGFVFELGSETGNKIIRYYAKGTNDTLNFSRVRIPRALMDDPYTVIAGEEVTPTLLDSSNSTYAYLYFTYNHTTQTVTIFTSETMRLYTDLLKMHLDLETNLERLNSTYRGLLENYNSLLANYTQLRESYGELNNSYTKIQGDSSKNVQNTQNLAYVFAVITGVFIAMTVYLSKSVHRPSSAVSISPPNPRGNAHSRAEFAGQ